jgi:hypothetical protein
MDKEILELAELHSKAPTSLSIEQLETIVQFHRKSMSDICSAYLEWIWEQAKAKTDKEYQRAEQELNGLTEMWNETEPLLKKYQAVLIQAVLETKKEQK